MGDVQVLFEKIEAGIGVGDGDLRAYCVSIKNTNRDNYVALTTLLAKAKEAYERHNAPLSVKKERKNKQKAAFETYEKANKKRADLVAFLTKQVTQLIRTPFDLNQYSSAELMDFYQAVFTLGHYDDIAGLLTVGPLNSAENITGLLGEHAPCIFEWLAQRADDPRLLGQKVMGYGFAPTMDAFKRALQNNKLHLVDSYMDYLPPYGDEGVLALMAKEKDDPNYVRLLYKRGLDLDCTFKDGHTAFSLAVENKNYTFALELLKWGADPRGSKHNVIDMIHDRLRSLTTNKVQDLEESFLFIGADNAELAEATALEKILRAIDNPPSPPTVSLAGQTQYDALVCKGGGPKGIAYVELINRLVKQGILQAYTEDEDHFTIAKENGEEIHVSKRGLLRHTRQFGGTSAGAIYSTLQMLNYRLDELDDVITQLDMTAFLDFHPSFAATGDEFVEKLADGSSLSDLSSHILSWVMGTLAHVSGVNKAAEYIPGIHYLAGKDTEAFLEYFSTYFGVCSGNNLHEWLVEKGQTKLNEFGFGHMDAMSLTFQEAAELKDKKGDPIFGELRIVGADLVSGRAIVFSKETTPNDCIFDAVRISASVPGLFAAWPRYQKIPAARGEVAKRVAVTEAVNVDGGIADNFPRNIYKNKGSRTLGLCLVSDENEAELKQLQQGKELEPIKKRLGSGGFKGIVSFISRVIKTFREVQNYEVMRDPAKQEDIVFVNNCGVKLTDFNLSEGRKKALKAAGDAAGLAFAHGKAGNKAAILSPVTLQNLVEVMEHTNEGYVLRFPLALKSDHVHQFIYELYRDATEEDVQHLRRLVNPNKRDSQKNTALHIARFKKDEATVQRLLQAGANPNAKNNRGDKPGGTVLGATLNIAEGAVTHSGQIQEEKDRLVHLASNEESAAREQIQEKNQMLEQGEAARARLATEMAEVMQQKAQLETEKNSLTTQGASLERMALMAEVAKLEKVAEALVPHLVKGKRDERVVLLQDLARTLRDQVDALYDGTKADNAISPQAKKALADSMKNQIHRTLITHPKLRHFKDKGDTFKKLAYAMINSLYMVLCGVSVVGLAIPLGKKWATGSAFFRHDTAAVRTLKQFDCAPLRIKV